MCLYLNKDLIIDRYNFIDVFYTVFSELTNMYKSLKSAPCHLHEGTEWLNLHNSALNWLCVMDKWLEVYDYALHGAMYLQVEHIFHIKQLAHRHV